MKATLTRAALAGLIAATAAMPSFAQMQDNTERQLSCSNGGYDSEGVRHCEMRELSAAYIGSLNVDSGPNGAASIKGWSRRDVLVRARVESRGNTDADATIMATQVMIDTSGGQVRASGPQSHDNSWWSVSYEIFVPQTTDVTVKTNNGAVAISDVRGNLHFEVNNGAVHLKRVAGDVSGSTSNGAITAELVGNNWDGRQLDLSTHNGAVTVSIPSQYSAHIKAETNNGGIQTDFPVTISGDIQRRPRDLDFNVGAGGSLIHVKTSNGAVRIKRTE